MEQKTRAGIQIFPREGDIQLVQRAVQSEWRRGAGTLWLDPVNQESQDGAGEIVTERREVELIHRFRELTNQWCFKGFDESIATDSEILMN